ncbi:hypothetical protein B0H13DRAFT_1852388 [Mycena leptocephala]|nr:hypothetical protein B0H13DRAFT_1852388 [Mycena leptocephala]
MPHRECTRTKTTRSVTIPESEESMRRHIIRKFREILKESDQARAPGTTVERQARWNIGSSPAISNAANAAAVASATATKAATRRAKLFKDAKVPHLPLVAAGGVTQLKKLAIGHFGIVWTEKGLRIAKGTREAWPDDFKFTKFQSA